MLLMYYSRDKDYKRTIDDDSLQYHHRKYMDIPTFSELDLPDVYPNNTPTHGWSPAAGESRHVPKVVYITRNPPRSFILHQ